MSSAGGGSAAAVSKPGNCKREVVVGPTTHVLHQHDDARLPANGAHVDNRPLQPSDPLEGRQGVRDRDLDLRVGRHEARLRFSPAQPCQDRGLLPTR